MALPAVNLLPPLESKEPPKEPRRGPMAELIRKVNAMQDVLILNSKMNYLERAAIKIEGEPATALKEMISQKKAAMEALTGTEASFAQTEIDTLEMELAAKLDQKYRVVVPVKIYSRESINTCEKQHQSTGCCENFGYQGTWSDVPPAGIENFPRDLPIEFFIKKDGNFVQDGDMIAFEFEGRRIELIVHHFTTWIGSTSLPSFEDHLKYMIKASGAYHSGFFKRDIEFLIEQIRKEKPMPENTQYVWFNNKVL